MIENKSEKKDSKVVVTEGHKAETSSTREDKVISAETTARSESQLPTASVLALNRANLVTLAQPQTAYLSNTAVSNFGQANTVKLSTQQSAVLNSTTTNFGSSNILTPGTITTLPIKHITTPRYEILAQQFRYTQAIPYLKNYSFQENVKRVEPVSSEDKPIRIKNYFIQPDRDKKQLRFIKEEPQLIDFSLSINKESSETAVATGGIATISVSLYQESSVSELEKIRKDHKDLFKPYRKWQFLPIELKNIKADLKVAEQEISGPVQANVSNMVGRVIFIVNLNQMGATNWYNQIHRNNIDGLHGLIAFSMTYFAKEQKELQVKELSYNILLHQLLSGISLDQVTVINPLQTLETQIIVQGSPIISNVSIDFKPSKGQVPQNFTFGPDGGKATVKITDQDLKDLEIDISHKVDFDKSGWPIIRERKTLTYQNNNWSEVIDPASWITKYTLMAVLLDENGQVISADSNLSLNRVICELAYSADYLEGDNAIISVVETHSEKIQEIHFPLPEGEAQGQLKLSVTAIRSKDGLLLEPNMSIRNLSPSATFIIVKVRPDGSIEVSSNEDAITEMSIEDKILGTLEELYPETQNAFQGAQAESGRRPATESASPSFKKLLRYLKTNEEEFSAIEPYYFPELERYLIHAGILSECDLLDRNNFHNAVAEFQDRNGLATDGIPGETTLWNLQEPYVLDHPMEIRVVEADRVAGYEEGYNRFRLRQDAAFYYEGLREEVLSQGGVITSSGSLRDLSARVTPGRSSKSMHYTGIAFDLYIHSGMRNPEIDPYIITKQGRKWVVYCRVPFGGETMSLDAIVWDSGKTSSQKVIARVINFTELAAKYGFYNISSRSCFPSNYLCAEWWHFQNEYLLTPYISQFGPELLRLNTIDYNRLKNSPLWSNRKKIFGRNWF